jgi:hypothetical protein
MWVGIPIRGAFDLEEPIKLDQIVADRIDDEEVESGKKRTKSFLEKYRSIIREGKKLQHAIFLIVSRIESLKNLFSWKSRWLSSVMYWLLICLLLGSLVLPQNVLLWLLMTLVLLDQFADTSKKQRLMSPYLHAIGKEVEESNFPAHWKMELAKSLSSFNTKIDDVVADFSASVLHAIFFRASRRLGWKNIPISLGDFTSAGAAGPVTVGMILEIFYERYHNGNEDWWKSVKTSIHPKNLIKSHLVSDWEEFNPSSLFS